jgi:hypothetical protein
MLAATASGRCRIKSSGVYQAVLGSPAGSVGGGQTYVERTASAGPSAPIAAAISATSASACATRMRASEARARPPGSTPGRETSCVAFVVSAYPPTVDCIGGASVAPGITRLTRKTASSSGGIAESTTGSRSRS